MRRLAEGVHQLDGFPPNFFNVYLLDDVLVDAGTRHAGSRILRQLRGWKVGAHALTHVHPDHQGASNEVCRALEIPLYCGEDDAPLMETGRIEASQPMNWVARAGQLIWRGPAHPVERGLREGDEVGGFTVLEVGGHSPGHVAFWRESDRVLVLGDVVLNMSLVTGIPGLHDAARVFTPEPERNRAAARRLGALEPTLVCFGHGPPLRDTGRFVSFVEGLAV